MCARNATLSRFSTNGVVVEAYGYDPLGRRAYTTTATASGSVTTWHAYDGIHCVADLDADGNVLRSYTYGPGIDNLLAITIAGGSGATPTVLFALTDPLGTVHALADSTGTIVESYRYDAWGNVLAVYDSSGTPIQNHKSAISNRFLFQGREHSFATGLTHFRARWYDPATGRWLSNDPIGISGGLNQYVFCGNDPVNGRDPMGLCEDGEKQVQLYLNDLRAERPTILEMPEWSVGMASDGTFRDIRNDPRTWLFRGRVLRGDQMGNVQAGYGLAMYQSPAFSWVATRAAEVWFSGDRSANWREDARGSFEMNDFGIEEAIKDLRWRERYPAEDFLPNPVGLR